MTSVRTLRESPEAGTPLGCGAGAAAWVGAGGAGAGPYTPPLEGLICRGAAALTSTGASSRGTTRSPAFPPFSPTRSTIRLFAASPLWVAGTTLFGVASALISGGWPLALDELDHAQ